MAFLFQNKYRIASARHANWNYADSGMYFITICVMQRRWYFGSVHGEEMCLNNIGRIANQFWLDIPRHFLNVTLDEYIIMPNHIHGILFIDNDDVHRNGRRDEALPRLRGTRRLRDTLDEALPRLYTGDHPQMSKISPKPHSLSVIIGSFKSACTKHIRLTVPDFSWQPRFYDRIIRDEHELHNVRNYIYYNPAKWEHDRNNTENLYI